VYYIGKMKKETKNNPEILSTELLDGQTTFDTILQVESLHLRFSNGAERHFRRVANKGRGAVLIVPVLESKTVLLINEYCAGTKRYELQLPKGGIDEGETVLEAANRELKEEVGKGAKKLKRLTQLAMAPGFMPHCTDIVLAEDLYDERLQGDEPEQLEVVPWPIKKIHELAMNEKVTDSRSLAALYMVKEMMNA